MRNNQIMLIETTTNTTINKHSRHNRCNLKLLCQTHLRERNGCATHTPFGPLTQGLVVADDALPFLHPAALVWHCCGLTAFGELIARAMQEGPSTLMVYSDGITPQYGLSKHD